MSSSNSNFPAGYVPITTSSLEPGSGNPRDSAASMGQSSNAKLASLNAAVGGKRKYRGGAQNGEVPAPQFQMQYTPTGGPGTDPNNQIANLTSKNMQTTAWSADDNAATKMGGRKRYRRGGSDWDWGCYSGGKKSRRRSSRKTRKHRKKTRRHRRR